MDHSLDKKVKRNDNKLCQKGKLNYKNVFRSHLKVTADLIFMKSIFVISPQHLCSFLCVVCFNIVALPLCFYKSVITPLFDTVLLLLALS